MTAKNYVYWHKCLRSIYAGRNAKNLKKWVPLYLYNRSRKELLSELTIKIEMCKYNNQNHLSIQGDVPLVASKPFPPQVFLLFLLMALVSRKVHKSFINGDDDGAGDGGDDDAGHNDEGD